MPYVADLISGHQIFICLFSFIAKTENVLLNLELNA